MQDNDQRRVIEINGVKLEVDMRYAKRVDELRVGSKVRVLIKSYGESYNTYTGVIIGFEEFQKLPTIVVAYLESSWQSADIKFVNYNSNTEGVEIVSSVNDETDLNRADAIGAFEREITKKERELADLREKRNYFEQKFGMYWNMQAPVEAV